MTESTDINREELIRFVDEGNYKLFHLRGIPDFHPEKLIAEVYQKANLANYDFGKGQCLLNMGFGAFLIRHDLKEAVMHINQGLEIFKEQNNKQWIANAQLVLGIIYNSGGDSEAALYTALRGIEYFKNNPDDIDYKVMAYYVIGTIYKDLKKYDEAEAYFNIALACPNLENDTWGGRCYTGLSNIYTEQKKYEQALSLSFKALKLLQDEKNNIGESRALNDIGNIYTKLKDYNKALKFLKEALEIRERVGIKHFSISSMIDIAVVYAELKNTKEAITYLEQAEVIAKEIKALPKLAGIYEQITKIYYDAEDFKQAFFYGEKILKLTLEINNKETEEKINKFQTALIKEKEEEIERIKNVELKHAYELISEKNKEITDSINYAKRIQNAILPSEQELKSALNNHFVLYKPKDIVAGDFFWCIETTTSTNKKLSVIAAADCTGHGVPGAFMSMLGYTLLNQTIKNNAINTPAEVLDFLNSELPKNLKSNEQDVSIRDGMDIALCAIDFENKKLFFAAANNPCWIVRKNEVIELKADKQPISASTDMEKKPFTNQQFDLQEGDSVYLFTDGYADQFGGPKGKKFKYKQLEELLLSVSEIPMNKQSLILNQKFEDWKGNLEQVDDVLLIGIKI